MAELIDYDIQSWTPDAIVMRRDFDCATELFTIDLNTKAVSGAGHKTNQDEPGCKMNTDDTATWTYQLVRDLTFTGHCGTSEAASRSYDSIHVRRLVKAALERIS